MYILILKPVRVVIHLMNRRQVTLISISASAWKVGEDGVFFWTLIVFFNTQKQKNCREYLFISRTI